MSNWSGCVPASVAEPDGYGPKAMVIFDHPHNAEYGRKQ
jgi:hypothetical protein